MSDSEFVPEELDALLAGNVASDGRALRETLRGPVSAAFVRRHRRRRVRRVVSLAACYLLGIVTIYAWQQVSASPPGHNDDAIVAKPDETTHSEKSVPEGPVSAPVTPQIAVAAEPGDVPHAPVAKPVKKSRFDLLRELGDHQLLADRNPEQALRCYRVALRYATAEEFTAASCEGTWLLRAICLDSKQEKDHAPEKS